MIIIVLLLKASIKIEIISDLLLTLRYSWARISPVSSWEFLHISKTSLVFLPEQFYVLWLYDVFVETDISCSYFAAYPSNVACVFMRVILKKTQIVNTSSL